MVDLWLVCIPGCPKRALRATRAVGSPSLLLSVLLGGPRSGGHPLTGDTPSARIGGCGRSARLTERTASVKRRGPRGASPQLGWGMLCAAAHGPARVTVAPHIAPHVPLAVAAGNVPLRPVASSGLPLLSYPNIPIPEPGACSFALPPPGGGATQHHYVCDKVVFSILPSSQRYPPSLPDCPYTQRLRQKGRERRPSCTRVEHGGPAMEPPQWRLLATTRGARAPPLLPRAPTGARGRTAR